ncbi:hypothetical protein ABK040_005666 [Willaertia magna]
MKKNSKKLRQKYLDFLLKEEERQEKKKKEKQVKASETNNTNNTNNTNQNAMTEEEDVKNNFVVKSITKRAKKLANIQKRSQQKQVKEGNDVDMFDGVISEETTANTLANSSKSSVPDEDTLEKRPRRHTKRRNKPY